ncbi:MAG: ATP-grasp domain-containing protein [Pirellulaceae bacterium]|nr:ATP-grasp domain-containing protein [Pirellulaceae bacterium]
MRVFLYEFVTGGGFFATGVTPQTDDHFLQEGRAMVQAISNDFSKIPAVQLSRLQDNRIPAFSSPGCVVHQVANHQEAADAFSTLTQTADWTLLIAPEIDNRLAELCQQVEENGGRLLGPNSRFAALAADKWELHRCFVEGGVPTPDTFLCEHPPHDIPPAAFPLVAKPRYGAGSLQISVLPNRDALGHFKSPQSQHILQKLMPGQAVSTSVLCGDRKPWVLPTMTQDLSRDGRFSYLGGHGPLPKDLCRRAHSLVMLSLHAMPPTIGYVGVDLILGPAPDGSDDRVIEINPRMTTSYIGLRQLAEQNLAQAILEIAQGRSSDLSFRDSTIRFSSAGTVQREINNA